MKARILIGVFAAVTVLFCGAVSAHKVNLFAYVESGTVYTESYFPDGRPVEGGKVSVLDAAGQVLLEGVTDPEGLFRFPVPKVDDLTIELDATMGHKNSFKLKKAEVEAGQ